MTPNIRVATPADAPAILTVERASIRELCAEAYSPKEIEAWLEQQSADKIAAAMWTRTFLVTESDDENRRVIGYASVNPDTREIYSLYVAPEAIRRGVGGALLAECERLIAKAGGHDVFIDASLNAAPFYERHGYARGGETKHPLACGRDLRCVKMTKCLESVL